MTPQPQNVDTVVDAAAAASAATPLDDSARAQRMRKVIFAAGAGHFVEWFDFGDDQA